MSLRGTLAVCTCTPAQHTQHIAQLMHNANSNTYTHTHTHARHTHAQRNRCGNEFGTADQLNDNRSAWEAKLRALRDARANTARVFVYFNAKCMPEM